MKAGPHRRRGQIGRRKDPIILPGGAVVKDFGCEPTMAVEAAARGPCLFPSPLKREKANGGASV